MKKKIGLLTLALLSFGLVACGGESTPTEGPATDTPTEQPAEKPTEKPTETPVIAVLTINVSGEKKVGEVITFVAFLDGSPLTSQSDVTYTCSDAEAMEINGNKATLLKAGTFTVNAAHKNGAKASVELTIEEGQKLLTIAEAKKAADGTLVHIQGKITASAGKSAFIADETGGMSIFSWWSGSDDTAVNNKRFTAGDSVDMVAQVSSHEGAKELISYTNGAAIDGCYAKKLDTEVDSMTPINLNETVLKSLTKASIGDVYTFDAAYVSEQTLGEGGLYTVTLKMGETTFALKSNGSTSRTSSYDPDFDDLKARFDALQLEEGDVIKVTTPFASVYNGTNQFAFYSQGTKFERVTPLTVKTVTIDGDETRNLVAGDTLTLTAAVAPASFTGGVTWSSDHPEIATVADGVVTAVAAGTAIITATSVDNPAVSDTVTINVTAAAVPATSVTLNKTEATLHIKTDETVTLTATMAPEDTTDSITWSSSDATVATVADGVVTALKAGTATITAKANDTALATCTITVVEFSTISEIKKGNSYYLKGVVSAKNSKAFVLSDATGSIYTYMNATPSVNIGDVVTVKATASEHNTCLQLGGNPEVNVLTGETGTPEEATPLTAEVATAWADGTHNTVADNKKYSWRTTIGKTSNGKYYLLPIEGSSTVIEPVYLSATDFPLIVGKEYDVEAFYIGYTGDYAQMVITKVAAPEVYVGLNKETESVRVGQQVTLTATVSLSEGFTDNSVTWTTSDEAIATVADGVVTGVAIGTATITATSVADPTKSASCVVTVESAFEAQTFNKVTSTADIAVGDTVTLVCPLAAGAKVVGAFNSGNYYGGLDVTISENSFQSLADMTTFTVEAGSSEGKFLLKDIATGKYLQVKYGNNNIYHIDDAAQATDWQITINDQGNVVISCTVSGTKNGNPDVQNRSIRWNTGSPRFTTYTSGQTAIDLYELAA